MKNKQLSKLFLSRAPFTKKIPGFLAILREDFQDKQQPDYSSFLENFESHQTLRIQDANVTLEQERADDELDFTASEWGSKEQELKDDYFPISEAILNEVTREPFKFHQKKRNRIKYRSFDPLRRKLEVQKRIDKIIDDECTLKARFKNESGLKIQYLNSAEFSNLVTLLIAKSIKCSTTLELRRKSITLGSNAPIQKEHILYQTMPLMERLYIKYNRRFSAKSNSNAAWFLSTKRIDESLKTISSIAREFFIIPLESSVVTVDLDSTKGSRYNRKSTIGGTPIIDRSSNSHNVSFQELSNFIKCLVDCKITSLVDKDELKLKAFKLATFIVFKKVIERKKSDIIAKDDSTIRLSNMLSRDDSASPSKQIWRDHIGPAERSLPDHLREILDHLKRAVFKIVVMNKKISYDLARFDEKTMRYLCTMVRTKQVSITPTSYHRRSTASFILRPKAQTPSISRIPSEKGPALGSMFLKVEKESSHVSIKASVLPSNSLRTSNNSDSQRVSGGALPPGVPSIFSSFRRSSAPMLPRARVGGWRVRQKGPYDVVVKATAKNKSTRKIDSFLQFIKKNKKKNNKCK